MFSKIIFGVLIVSAVVYVAYHKLSGKPVYLRYKDGGRRDWLFRMGWLFTLAVAIVGGAVGADKEMPSREMMCYKMSISPADDDNMLKKLHIAWITLNTYSGHDAAEMSKGMDQATENFKKAINEAVEKGKIDKELASRLVMLHKTLAYYAYRENSKISCYDVTQLGGLMYSSEDTLVKQLGLLREAKKKGALSQDVFDKAQQTIMRNTEIVTQVKEFYELPADKRDEAAEFKKLQDEKLEISDLNKKAATYIMEMEELKPAQKPQDKPVTGTDGTAKDK